MLVEAEIWGMRTAESKTVNVFEKFGGSVTNGWSWE